MFGQLFHFVDCRVLIGLVVGLLTVAVAAECSEEEIVVLVAEEVNAAAVTETEKAGPTARGPGSAPDSLDRPPPRHPVAPPPPPASGTLAPCARPSAAPLAAVTDWVWLRVLQSVGPTIAVQPPVV